MKGIFTKSFLLAGITAAGLLFTGCKKEEAPSQHNEIVGTEQYLKDMLNLGMSVQTKGGEMSPEDEKELLEATQPMIDAADSYLKQNGYDPSEDFADDDPNVILLADALAEASMNTSTIEVIGNCLLEAVGIGSLPFDLRAYFTAGMSKSALKKAAKTVLSKACPYVSAAIFAGTFAWCLYQNLD